MLLSISHKRPANLQQENPAHEDLWLDINSTEAGIDHFYIFLDFMKRAWNIDDASFVNMKIALSEALLNSANHGNKWNEDKQIHIHASRDKEHTVVSIADEGDGFDYKRPETIAENMAKPEGRGVLIMYCLADLIQFSEGGKCVKLFFGNRKSN